MPTRHIYEFWVETARLPAVSPTQRCGCGKFHSPASGLGADAPVGTPAVRRTTSTRFVYVLYAGKQLLSFIKRTRSVSVAVKDDWHASAASATQLRESDSYCCSGPASYASTRKNALQTKFVNS